MKNIEVEITSEKQAVLIGDEIKIACKIRKGTIKIIIDAPKKIKIKREELK